MNCTVHEAKIKTLISCAVTVQQLISAAELHLCLRIYKISGLFHDAAPFRTADDSSNDVL